MDDVLGQRARLVDDHLANPRAIPLDVLEQKQTALGEELQEAQRRLAAAERKVDKSEEGLKLARKSLADSSRTYRRADPQTRRRWNQVFFSKVYVSKDGVTGAELTDEFGSLLAKDLATRLKKVPPKPKSFSGSGSNVAALVETAGIEPASAVA